MAYFTVPPSGSVPDTVPTTVPLALFSGRPKVWLPTVGGLIRDQAGGLDGLTVVIECHVGTLEQQRGRGAGVADSRWWPHRA